MGEPCLGVEAMQDEVEERVVVSPLVEAWEGRAVWAVGTWWIVGDFSAVPVETMEILGYGPVANLNDLNELRATYDIPRLRLRIKR